jgi:allantoate deiminase
MTNYLKRAGKVLSRINELASISDSETYLTRVFGTAAFVEATQKMALWMRQAGLDTRIDSIGNVHGKLRSDKPGAKTLVIASHIDTVVNAGKFDGPLGVFVGLDVLEHLFKNKMLLPFHIELIAFSDEEGVRFHSTYLGSKVVTGDFDSTLLNFKDKDGKTLHDVIKNIGGDPYLLYKDAIPADEWLAYYEIHIEQGPVLYERNIPVGLVSGIAGQKRVELTFEGHAGHAGTVPMDLRRDALTAGAAFILFIEDYALRNKEKIVATIGKLEIENGASNVIPGKLVCSLDIRSVDNQLLDAACTEFKEKLQLIAKDRNIATNWNLIQESSPVVCNVGLNETLKQVIIQCGYEVVELVSGAGHDAVPVSKVSPVSMLFVRCDKGISHHPLEHTEAEDIAAAIHVSENFIGQLIKKHENHYGNISIDKVSS